MTEAQIRQVLDAAKWGDNRPWCAHNAEDTARILVEIANKTGRSIVAVEVTDKVFCDELTVTFSRPVDDTVLHELNNWIYAVGEWVEVLDAEATTVRLAWTD